MYLLGELGLDEISTHMSNSNAKANSGAGLVDTSVYSYKRSGVYVYNVELPTTTII